MLIQCTGGLWCLRMLAIRAARWVVVALAFVVSTAVVGAPQDVARGMAWLATQVQADGELLTPSSVAARTQAHCEAASTLLRLGSDSSKVIALLTNISTGSHDPTESLACEQYLRQQLGQTILNPEVELRRVSQQGYAAYEGFGVANALDTGWALAAQLQNLSTTDRERVITWLQSDQTANGSFSTAGQPDLLATAVVLRALRSVAPTNQIAATVANSAATYLLGQRNAAGHWANDAALTSIVFEAVHPYTGGNPAIASGVNTYLLSSQLANGSWQGDSYVTAVALRALALAAQPPLNPTTAGIKIKFVDARNAAALPGVSLSGTGPSSIAANSDAAGQIELLGLSAGTYSLTATLAGYAAVNLNVTLVAGVVSDLGTIQMLVPANPSAVVISGTVRDQDSGAALADVTVSVNGQNLSATTSTDGRYLISNVAPGALTLSAAKSGYLSASGGASVQAGQVLDFSPRLTLASAGGGALCTIQGTIRDASSQAVLSGVIVQVAGANTAAATTDAAGRYSISGLGSGNVTLVASKGGYDVAQASTRLICDALRPTSVDFSPRLYATNQSPPNANSAGLGGIVVDAGTNQPIAGAQITVTPDIGAAKFATSQADGRFAVQGLNGASAQLQVQATGYQDMTAQYALLPLQDQDLGQLRLRKPKVEQLLADLKILSVKRHTAQTDAQTLQVSGAVEVQLMNAGNQTAPANVAMVGFSDTNRNGQFDTSTDTVLGQATIAPALAPGQVITLTIPVAGTLPFRDAPIHVLVDALHQVTESNTANNVASTAQQALYAPDAQQAFQPALKWEWKGNGVLPSTRNIMMAPIAIPTRDTNGDGRIDAKDVSDIVVTSFGGGYTSLDGVIRILNGANGSEVETFTGSRVHQYANLAGADLDGDGAPEIVAVGTEYHRPVAYKRDGTFLWKATQGEASVTYDGGHWGGITISDLDGDGVPEVLFQRNVYNGRTGELKWMASEAYAGSHPGQVRFSVPVTADLFATGKQDVILGASVYDHQGTLRWVNHTVGDGFVAIADFNGDGIPEIVVAANGRVSLLNRDGTLVWGPVTLPGGAIGGGPPTIADVDGDGIPEIGVASSYRYTVLRADGTVMWSRDVNDYSSGITASTAFDFLGDGKSKVLYLDEASIFVYEGATGGTLLRIPSSTATTMEQPIVVDADRDGHAEFVTTRNNLVSHANGEVGGGVRVFQDVNNSWVPTRSIWNQHAYSITNINDDMSVPRNPVPSWQAHNSFRLNKRLEADPRAIADLTLSYVRVADAGAQGATLTVRVGNGGSYLVPAGTRLAVYNVDAGTGWPGAAARIAVVATSVELQPGQYEDVAVTLSGALSSIAPTGQLWLVGDDDGTGKHDVPDFDRANNTVIADVAAIATNLNISVSTDKPAYNELEQAVFTATVGNAGSFARTPQGRLSVLDANGVLVQALPLPAPAPVGPGAQVSSDTPWAVTGVLAGNYRVLAELVTPQGLVYGSATANFAVQASQGVTLSASIRTDRVRYTAAQSIALSSRLVNLTANTAYDALTATTTVLNGTGQGVFTQAEPVAQLAPLGQRSYGYTLNAGTLPPGSYQAQFIVRNAQNQVVAQSSANFQVVGSDQTGIGLTGLLQATPNLVPIGSNVDLQLATTHNGNALIANAIVRVRVVNPDTGTAIETFSQNVTNWPVGATQNFNWTWAAAGTDGQALVAAATVEVNGRELPLAQAPFSLRGVARIQASPSSLDFGSQAVGSAPVTRTYTVTSTGSATATFAATALSGAAAADYALDGGTCASGLSLPVGASCTVIVRFIPGAVGTRAALATSSAQGVTQTATVSLSGIVTQASAPLTGSLSATPASVPVGSPVSLFYNISNPNGQAVSTTATLQVMPESSGTPATSWSLPMTVAANGSAVGNQSWTPTGPAGSRYVATLSALTGTPAMSVVLATASFAVAAPPLQVNASIQNGAQPRILMLASCSPSDDANQPQNPACTENKASALRQYFSARGLNATVVTTRAEFENYMRCGNYNTYWVSAGSQKLSNTVVKELREAAERGDALILDGVQDSRDAPLHAVLGIQANGTHSTADQLVTLGGDIYPSGGFATLGKPVRYTLQGGATQAVLAAGGPAIVSNAIGRGRGLAFAFDLGTLMAKPNAAADAALGLIIDRSLGYLVPTGANAAPLTSTVVGAPVEVQTLIANAGQVVVNAQVQATLPAGARAWGALPLASESQVSGQTVLSWTLSLAAGQSQVLSVQVSFAAGGTASIPVVFSATGSNGGTTSGGVTHSLTVLDASTAAANAVQALAGLNPTPPAEANAASRARSAAQSASQLMGQGRYAEALAQWISASDEVRSIASVTTTAYRLSLALAIQSAERQLCNQWACITGELDFTVNGQVARQVPLQATIVGSRIIRNNCPAQIKDIPVTSRWVNRRTGAEVQNLWDNLTIPGFNNNRRDNGWQALGQENDIIDVILTAQWQNEILHLDRDEFRIIVLPPVLSGTLSTNATHARAGQNVTLQRSVKNTGAMGNNIPIKLRITNTTQGGSLVQEFSQTVTLNPGETNNANQNWQVQGAAGSQIKIELIATVSGAQQVLATANFTIDP